MDEKGCNCVYEKLYTVQFDGIRGDLHDLTVRVARLETARARGLMLLVANLLGMLATLGSGLL